MGRRHSYNINVRWTGNLGTGTSGYKEYERSFELSAQGKQVIAGSSDSAFRGDRTRWNPEELLIASLSACHKLWYLHLCADAGLAVLDYSDEAVGEMEELPEGGRITRVLLRPYATFAVGTDLDKAAALHGAAHRACFIANSVNCAVLCEPTFRLAPP